MKTFVIDVAKCNGCYSCQIVCKDEHCDADWSPYALPQPDTGQFWLSVDEKTRGQVPVVKLSYTPLLCLHCADAPCESVAMGNAVYRRDDCLIIIDPVAAKGQRQIVDACPFDAVYWNDELELPQKCTGCAHLLDNGWDEPRCVDACPTGALQFGEEADFADLLAHIEYLPGSESCAPRVMYLNLPKRFIAASFIDFEADEVVIGATVRLISGASTVAILQTDAFGDVIFEQINPGIYRLEVSADGYTTKAWEADISNSDLSLGDLGLKHS